MLISTAHNPYFFSFVARSVAKFGGVGHWRLRQRIDLGCRFAGAIAISLENALHSRGSLAYGSKPGATFDAFGVDSAVAWLESTLNAYSDRTGATIIRIRAFPQTASPATTNDPRQPKSPEPNRGKSSGLLDRFRCKHGQLPAKGVGERF